MRRYQILWYGPMVAVWNPENNRFGASGEEIQGFRVTGKANPDHKAPNGAGLGPFYEVCSTINTAGKEKCFNPA